MLYESHVDNSYDIKEDIMRRDKSMLDEGTTS